MVVKQHMPLSLWLGGSLLIWGNGPQYHLLALTGHPRPRMAISERFIMTNNNDIADAILV